ncbi:MAG: hypothetical protein DWI57_18030 [Chloroflexi bacterium]|nr:MAG: hypothetical protein DWI57_18030 [Chloroflexota bacterium]
MDTQALIQDFLLVAKLAEARLDKSEIEVEILKAPHRPPSRLPAGKMAVYIFSYGDIVLKVGQAGPKSGARYTSQHYNATSAPSTLAASLLKGGGEIGVSDLTVESAGDWIKKNTDRINFLLKTEHGVPVLTLLEVFLQCKLKPRFEGFASQR